MAPAIFWNQGIITRQEVDSEIALGVRANILNTYLRQQDGHAVNVPCPDTLE